MEENVYDQAVLEDTIREAPGDSVELNSINADPHIWPGLVWLVLVIGQYYGLEYIYWAELIQKKMFMIKPY